MAYSLHVALDGGEAQDHPDYATSLHNMAALLREMGDYGKSKDYYQQALEAFRAAVGEEHPDYASVLNNLANVYHETGEYARAESRYRLALKACAAAVGEDHPDYAAGLNTLGMLHHEMGEYAKAESHYRQALATYEAAVGKDYPHYATTLSNMAALFGSTAREAEALTLMAGAAATDDLTIRQVFSIGSEKQRMTFLKTLQGNLAALLSLSLWRLEQVTVARRTALDLVLRRKAIGADALAEQRVAVLGGQYPELRETVRELTKLRAQIARKTLDGPTIEDADSHHQHLVDWNDQKETLEAELAHQIPEMDLERRLRTADRQAVAEALPEDSVLVEFVKFDDFDFEAVPARDEPSWKPARYVAFVMFAGELDEVGMVDLGEAEPIDRLIAAFRSSIMHEAEDRGVEEAAAIADGKDWAYERDATVLYAQIGDYSQRLKEMRGLLPDYEDSDERPFGVEGVSLREAVFDKLAPHLSGRTRLFLAPDGDLSRLPFEALPTSDGHYLIDDFQISYLSSGRDVLRFDTDSAVQAEPPLVAADPDFDLGAASVSTSSEIAGFKRLSGTRKEGERIAQMLGVPPMLGDGPLETTVKNARSPRILHIATHGFFRPDTPRDPNAQAHEVQTMSALDGGLLARLAHVENPLLRSGLALVGANTWLKGGNLPEEAEDGILMAEDVTGMDLLATELAVLSACQTGLGEVHSGEGVYGLRRAFVVAGTKTLVMSLWKVPDEQTRELMEDFYRRLLQGEPRAEALRKAQLEMKERHADPFYWGAFICQGNPRSLPAHELSQVSRPGHNH